MYEESICEGNNPHPLWHNESGTLRFTRTASATFTGQDSQFAGCQYCLRVYFTLSKVLHSYLVILLGTNSKSERYGCKCSKSPTV